MSAAPQARPVRRRRRVRWDVLVPSAVLALFALVAAAPGLVSRSSPTDCDITRSLEAPSAAHPLGRSVFGCDYLAETAYATRTSLAVAALVVVGTLLVAVVVGSTAGFYGGWRDAVLSRATDVWTSIPLLLGAVVVLSALQRRGVLAVAAVLVVFGWPAMARLQRASVLEASAQEYVTAARALGARPSRVLVRHVLPNALRPLLAYAPAYAGLVVGVEATLTYFGVGLQQPALSWGLLLLQAQDRLGQAPHLLAPAVALVVVVSSLVLLGQALQHRRDV